MDKVKIKTSTGFECELDQDAMDDIELLESMSVMSRGDTAAAIETPHFIQLVLGEERKKQLYDHCRNGRGKAPIGRVTDEVKEIIEALSSKKY